MMERWIAAFEAMDDRAQYDNLRIAEGSARRNPRRRAPRLKLVPRLVFNLSIGKSLSCPHDISAPPWVAPVVKIK